jgi:hypothetical protein
LLLFALVACIIVSVGSFAWGYHLAGYDGLVRWLILFGVVWLASSWFKWRWFPAPAVLFALGLASFGVWFEFGGGWMFNGAVFALFAWNLSEFERKLKFLPSREQGEIPGRTRRHVLRISLLVLVGFVFETIFLLLRGQFSIEWGLVALGILLFGSLQVVAWR